MPRIRQSAIHKRGSEGVALAGAGQSPFAASRSSADYAARGGRGEPRGRKSWRLVWGLIIQHGRRARRGKNGSAHSPGTHKLRCTRRRDDESRANLALHSVLIPTPA